MYLRLTQQRKRAKASLNPIERLLHVFVSAVLSSTRIRNLFVGYVALIHILMFGILFEASHRYVFISNAYH